jgi:hypothetical protein
MEKKILIKEIDKLKSTTTKDKFISQYIIYYMVNEARVEAFIEFGDEAMNLRVNELALTKFEDYDFNPDIEKITLEELQN